jgi:ribosomal protein S18 acetylase RimI-like enzyme
MSISYTIWHGPVTDELVAAFEHLTPFLSRSNPAPARERIAEIVESPATDQFVARDEDDGGRIVGVATLAVFRIPTGLRAWVEDVIADPETTGRGVGTGLTEAMIDRARELGCITVDLTSRPSREKANHLYKKVGFEQRDTNVYRYDLRS